MAKSIYNWFADKENLEFVNRLIKNGVEIKSAKVAEGKLKGKSFVFTGGLETLTREEGKNMVRKQGGDISESVSKETDYVVAGSEPGEKFDKAKKLGIKIISEKEFLEMIE